MGCEARASCKVTRGVRGGLSKGLDGEWIEGHPCKADYGAGSVAFRRTDITHHRTIPVLDLERNRNPPGDQSEDLVEIGDVFATAW